MTPIKGRKKAVTHNIWSRCTLEKHSASLTHLAVQQQNGNQVCSCCATQEFQVNTVAFGSFYQCFLPKNKCQKKVFTHFFSLFIFLNDLSRYLFVFVRSFLVFVQPFLELLKFFRHFCNLKIDDNYNTVSSLLRETSKVSQRGQK